MKTKIEPYRDNRFDVGRTTEIINNIKRNDRVMERLDQLQEIIEEMGGWFARPKLGENLVYKDKEGNEIDFDEFWDTLYSFVEVNQKWVERDSQSEYQTLVKINGRTNHKKTA